MRTCPTLRHLVFALACIALGVPGPAMAESVAVSPKLEGSITMAITAKFSVPTAKGARIASVRLTTADFLEVIAEKAGLPPPKSSRLVYQRELEDPGFDPVVVFAVFDGDRYDVTDLVGGDLPDEIPGFSAHVEGYSLRPSDNAVTQLAYEELTAVVIGDLPRVGFELIAAASAKGGLRLLTMRGIDVGLVSTGLTMNLIGALNGEDLPRDGAIVTGTIRYGPEKLVGP